VGTLEDAFVTLYRHIRADPLFKNVTILCIIENNYGNDANWLYGLTKRVAEMNNIYMLSDDISKKIGTTTTELSKLRGYDIMKTYISTNGLKFYRKLITFNNEYERAFPGPNPRIAMKSLMIQQLRQLKQYGKRKAKGSALVVITGIHTEDNKRLPLVDDVVMALNFFMTMSIRFFKKDIPNVPYADIASMRYRIVHMSEEPAYIAHSMAKKMTQRDVVNQQMQRTGLFQ